jgi:predicted kinase
MIEVLVGMVGSGKSTYTSKRARGGAIILNDDSLVQSLHGGNYKLYDQKLKALYKSLTMAAACQAVAIGRDIVVDATNLTRKTRARWVGLAHMLDQQVICTTFKVETHEIHAKRRADHDGRGYNYDHWLEIIKSHFNNYDPPSNSEGFNSVIEVEQRMLVNPEKPTMTPGE